MTPSSYILLTDIQITTIWKNSKAWRQKSLKPYPLILVPKQNYRYYKQCTTSVYYSQCSINSCQSFPLRHLHKVIISRAPPSFCRCLPSAWNCRRQIRPFPPCIVFADQSTGNNDTTDCSGTGYFSGVSILSWITSVLYIYIFFSNVRQSYTTEFGLGGIWTHNLLIFGQTPKPSCLWA